MSTEPQFVLYDRIVYIVCGEQVLKIAARLAAIWPIACNIT